MPASELLPSETASAAPSKRVSLRGWKAWLVFVFCLGGSTMLHNTRLPWREPVVDCGMMICFFIMLFFAAQTILRLVRRQWRGALNAAARTSFCLVTLAILIPGMSGDNFAVGLKIPEGMEVLEPLDRDGSGKAPVSTETAVPRLRVIKGMQPGMYDVECVISGEEAGTGFIKVFEVTHNTPLSAGKVRDASQRHLDKKSQDAFRWTGGVTIFEGDWGQPYGARFEVWFKPDGGGPERKVCEKVYKIEGWQR